LCVNIWRCFSDDDEYNEDQHDIIEQIQQLQQELEQTKTVIENQREQKSSADEQLKNSFNKLYEILVSFFCSKYEKII
jgi:septal ring factor EnvC (AmiA/AmiB activator)